MIVITDFLEEVGLPLDLKGWGGLDFEDGTGLWIKAQEMVEQRQVRR